MYYAKITEEEEIPTFKLLGGVTNVAHHMSESWLSVREKNPRQYWLAESPQKRIKFCYTSELTDDGMANIWCGVAVSSTVIKQSNKEQGQHSDSWETFVRVILRLYSCWKHVLWCAKLACKLKAKGLKHSELWNSVTVFSKWKWPSKE